MNLWPLAKRLKKAYAIAGITAKDVDVAEVHTVLRLQRCWRWKIWDFCKGKAAAAIAGGKTTIGNGKHVVVNPSGGLKGCGHPVGATGVKQIVELVEQLRGSAVSGRLPKQEWDLPIMSGSGATTVVHILKNNMPGSRISIRFRPLRRIDNLEWKILY